MISSSVAAVRIYFGFDLTMLFLDRVTIGWR